MTDAAASCRRRLHHDRQPGHGRTHGRQHSPGSSAARPVIRAVRPIYGILDSRLRPETGCCRCRIPRAAGNRRGPAAGTDATGHWEDGPVTRVATTMRWEDVVVVR